MSADMLLEQGRPADALARLAEQPDVRRSPVHVARLWLRTHEALGHHGQVLTLARGLVRRGLIEREEATDLIDRAGAELLHEAKGETWLVLWKDFKADERTLPRIALAGAAAYAAQGKLDDAARVLEAAIGTRMMPELLAEYARCDASQVSRRLEKAEIWRKQSPDDPDLLAALGELCLVGQIWGAAERYLQRSLQEREDARTHALLGNLYDRLDRPVHARRHWRQASMTGMVLPVLAADAPLPPADTRADPVVPDVEALEELTPFTAGGSSVIFPRVSALAEPAPAVSTDETVLVPTQTDIEDLFDSAVIPGIDPPDAQADTDPASRPLAQGLGLR